MQQTVETPTLTTVHKHTRGKSAVADRDTPLIRRCWYVLATSQEIAPGAMLRRSALGQDLLLWRSAAGVVSVLQNRCPHRSFPLHRGRLIGDRLQCGYHGLEFDASGRCAHVPSDPRPEAGAHIAARSYPVLERAPFIWVWMGEPEFADQSLAPNHHWLGARGWASITGYKSIKSNYVGLHENLLDTTHFSFLHAGNVGTPAYATAPIHFERHGSKVRQWRVLEQGVLPALYDEPMGLVGVPVDRRTDSWFETPGFHIAHAAAIDRRTEPPAEYRTKILHAITPAAQYETHYFWAVARDYAIEDRAVDDYIRAQIETAFEEDREALEWIDAMAEQDDRPDHRELSLGADRGGLVMRRILAQLAENEAKPLTQP